MSTKQRRVELKNCLYTDVGIQHINHTPLHEWKLLLSGVFQTPQTERLSAFVTVAEVCGNVKGFFAGSPRGRTCEVSGKFAAGCPVRQEARCLDRGSREKGKCHVRIKSEHPGQIKILYFYLDPRVVLRLPEDDVLWEGWRMTFFCLAGLPGGQ